MFSILKCTPVWSCIYTLQTCTLPCVPLLVARYKGALHFVTAFIFPSFLLKFPFSSNTVAKDAIAGQLPPPRPACDSCYQEWYDAGLDNFTAKSFSLVPPPSWKLNDKIEAENFMKTSEILSDDIASVGILENADYPKPTKAKLHNVINILERVCCFALYISILSIQKTATTCTGARFTIISIAHLNGKRLRLGTMQLPIFWLFFPDYDVEHHNANCFNNSSIVDK